MIGKFILNILVLTLASTVFCQSKKIHIGLELLPTVATQFSPTAEAKNPIRFSFGGGLIASKEIVRKKSYLKSGIFLLNKGYGYTVKVFTPQGHLYGKYRYTEHLNYLSIPINIGFRIKEMYFEFGPQIDYFVFRRQKHNSKVEDTSIPENINKLNLGGNFSAGTIIYPNSRRKTYAINLGAYASITSNPIFFNAGVKMGITKRLK
jgi:hypothetical protein